jgi:hypothetical protein
LIDVIKIGKSTIYQWAAEEDNPFADILRSIHAKQELIAWNKGLKGEYNANLIKLLLGKHGYHDKVDSNVEQRTTITNELSDSDLEKYIAE